MSWLPLSASLEYLCYGCTTNINNSFSVWTVFIRQILAYRDCPHTEKVNKNYILYLSNVFCGSDNNSAFKLCLQDTLSPKQMQ